MTFWSNHGHLEHQIGKVAMRHFFRGVEVLLCINISIKNYKKELHVWGFGRATSQSQQKVLFLRKIAAVASKIGLNYLLEVEGEMSCFPRSFWFGMYPCSCCEPAR